MFPFKTRLAIDRDSSQALYLQLSNQIIGLIKDHTLPPSTKLPSSRALSNELSVHRKTIVACYEELMLQGWIESIPKKGTYVMGSLPVLKKQRIVEQHVDSNNNKSGFTFIKNINLDQKPSREKTDDSIRINDGIPDVRLAPIDEIARLYRRVCSRKSIFEHLSYGSTYGNEKLRLVLSDYLNATRGLQTKKENILVTRGSQMGIWLSSQILINSGDHVIVGETNYSSANATFILSNANILKVRVDDEGISTKDIELLCREKCIKAVYVTPHHHHPTTVVLSAERRIHLLNLAKEYSFAIIEDDYDFDFNYNRSPILPLASHDVNNNVIYIGSFCKSVAPVFRVGYLVGPREIVEETSKLRGIIDRQGDAILELTFAEFIRSGDLDRHIRKVLKIYKQRRDLFCRLAITQLNEFIEFEEPIGGMAVWVKLINKYSKKLLIEVATKNYLDLSSQLYFDSPNGNVQFMRIGFAEHSNEELEQLIMRLKWTFSELNS